MNFQQRTKKLVICALTLFCSTLLPNLASAQLTIGIKATTPTFSSKETTKEYWEPTNRVGYGLTYVSTTNSYSVGMSFYHEMENAFVISDVLYRKKEVEYRMEMLNQLDRETSDLSDNHNIVSVPIVAGYKKNNLKIGLGPVFNIKVDSKYGLMEYEGFSLEGRKMNKAVQFLIGYEIKDHIQLDLRHEISLDSEGDDYHIVGNPLKIYSHPQSFSVSVGIYL